MCVGLIAACSKSEPQYDPPIMGFSGAEDYAKGLELLQKEDVPGAIPWFKKAIAQNNPEAFYHMGLLYARGDNVEQDYLRAKEYFYKAGMMGHPKALYYLGHLYGEGSGVKQDYVEALKWFWLSSSFGDKGAQRYLRIITKKVTAEEYNNVEEEVNSIWKTLPHDVFMKDSNMPLH